MFTAIFITEMIVKNIALGPRAYFYYKWNRFDAFIVISSIFDIILSANLGSNTNIIRVAPQMIRIVRILRLSRVLKLIKNFDGLLKLLRTLIYSLPQILNVGALLMLVLFIYSILGVFMF